MSVVFNPSGYGEASAEISFSKLKLIKTYLQATMCQVWQSSLTVNRKSAPKSSKHDEIIDILADAKALSEVNYINFLTLRLLSAGGSGYKLFVPMYSQLAIRIEHYMQNGPSAGGTARTIHAN